MNFKESIALNKRIKKIRTALQADIIDNDLYKLNNFERLIIFRSIQIDKMAATGNFETKEYHRRCNMFLQLTENKQIKCIIMHESENLSKTMVTQAEHDAIYKKIYDLTQTQPA